MTTSCYVFRDGRAAPAGSLVLALADVREAGGFVWVELDRPGIADFSGIEGALGLHPLAVEDAVQARDRPKLDLYDKHHFLALLTLRDRGATAPLDIGRVMAFIGEDFVVTVRHEDGDTLERARRRLGEGEVSAVPLDALHALLDTVVDDVAAVSGRVEESILAVADRVFGAHRSDEAHALYLITRQLLAMAHAVRPLIEPLRHLSSPGQADLETARRFQDVLDHALVIDREVKDFSELVEHLRGGNDSRIGLQQNADMRKIAAWAAVIAVPTAVTSFYGMNVPYPGFGQPVGVVVALALQILLALSLFVVFRNRRWL